MLINLNKLNESLEKKYFSESVTLEEKFSDMPDWLSKRILTTKYNYYDGQGRMYNKSRGLGVADHEKADAKNPNFGPRTSYINPKGDEKYSDKSLYAQLLEHGINLDKVKIIEGEKPTKRTDPRLQEPNIPIFLFKNNQVYIKGMNENEEYVGDRSYKPFKYLPMKTLLSDEVVAFAYIDGNDDENFQANVTRDSRRKLKGELDQIPNYERNKSRAGYSSWSQKWDKSGYRVIPSAEKYKAKLNELKCSKIYTLLDEKYQLLNEAKEELSNLLLQTDISSDDNPDFNRAFAERESIFEAFAEASKYYRRVLKTVDNITNNEVFTDKEKKDRLINIINWDSDYDQLIKYTKIIETKGPSVFNSVIDWI